MKTACFGSSIGTGGIYFFNNLHHIPPISEKYDIMKLNIANNGGKYGFS